MSDNCKYYSVKAEGHSPEWVRVFPYYGLNGKMYPSEETLQALLQERLDKDQAEMKAIRSKIIRVRDFLLSEGINLEAQVSAVLDPLWEQEKAIWSKHEKLRVIPVESNRGQTIEALEGWKLL